MDGNKDAAVKCMTIGKQALKDGDKGRAYRFLTKAKRLDPSLEVEDLVSSLLEELSMEEETENKEGKRSDKKETEDISTNDSNTGGKTQQGMKAAPDFSTEQADIVLKIRKTRDYYQILGLNKDCSAEEIRKAYRKVSLKVHPDKNKAPGSEEAFKAVAKAFTCLNDEELRQKYDQYGPEESNEIAQNRYARGYYSNGFYQETFDANDIFNTFFFGSPFANSGFPQAHFMRSNGMGRQAGRGVRQYEVRFGGFSGLLQLVPVLVLFLMAYFPFSSQPVYNLEQAAPYVYRHVTRDNAVPFFVKSQIFDKEYPPGSPSRSSVEAQVEREYREILSYNCRVELGIRYWNPSAETPNCDMLQRIKIY